MRTPLTVLLLAGGITLALAQSETHYYDRWQIRNRVSADFSSGTIVITDNDSFPHMSPGDYFVCHPISGVVQFAASPVGLLDRTGALMPNGDGIQNGFPIPLPSSSTRYYVFTFTTDGTGQVQYSVVDMTLNGGLGDVTDEKLVTLPGNYYAPDRFAIASADGLTHWVYFLNAFDSQPYSFRININTGLDTVPQVNDVPMTAQHGPIVPSMSGTRLVWRMIGEPNGFQTVQVDTETGLLHSPLFLPINVGDFRQLYISPSGDLLYGFNSSGQTDPLTQWDLSSGVAETVMASETVITQSSIISNTTESASIASDGRFYYVGMGTDHDLSFVAQPDIPSQACALMWSAIPLPETDFIEEGDQKLTVAPIWAKLGLLEEVEERVLTYGTIATVVPSPNPAHQAVVLAIDTPPASVSSLYLLDATGREVVRLPWSSGTQRITADIGNLVPGLYLLQVRDQKGLHATGRLLVQ